MTEFLVNKFHLFSTTAMSTAKGEFSMTHRFSIHDTTPPVRESVCIFASGFIFALIVIVSLMAA